MRKIYLLCAGGMSTSLLVENMKKAAKGMNFECSIEAHSIGKVDIVKRDANLILLGPQVKYQLKTVRSRCPGVIVDSIEPIDFGRMNGEKVMKKAIELLGS